MCQQNLCDVAAITPHSIAKRAKPNSADPVCIGTAVQKQCDEIVVTTLNCQVKRRLTFGGPRPLISAGVSGVEVNARTYCVHQGLPVAASGATT